MPPVAPHWSLGCDDLEPLPSQYAFLSDPVDLATPTAAMLLRRVRHSLPDAQVVSLRRFANKQIWRQFHLKRQLVEEENSGDPNAKLLFHGTKDPSSIFGSGRDSNAEGFDTRLGKGGSYSAPGCGSYFATHAAYPVDIHPRRANKDGTFDLVVAEVACGVVHDMGDEVDTTLQRPPPLRGTLLHHSVRGTEKSIGKRRSTDQVHGEQYVIYNHHQAYPHFLITIKTGRKTLINACSGRQLYAAKDKEWEDGLGAGKQGEVGADRAWRIEPLDNGTVKIINAFSGRQLYAAKGRDWGDGVGAGKREKVGSDGTWMIKQRDNGTVTIINACSGRQLYASKGKDWEKGVGAGAQGKVGDDGFWRMQDC